MLALHRAPESLLNSDRFVFEAGNLALDLANTRPISDGEFVERLPDPSALERWMALAGLQDGEGHPRDAGSSAHLLDVALRLRDAIFDVVESFVDGREPSAASIRTVNEVLGAVRKRERLVDRTGWRLETEREPVGPEAPLAPVAEALAELLQEAVPERVRQCDDEDCVLWFHDTSRGGQRRWCSMATCGNRNKVAAHYRRSKQD